MAAQLILAVCLFPLASLIHAAPPNIPIAQIPLTAVIPLHPQVLIAVGNSQSMDGNLAGAIMTGSGSLAAGLNSLNASTSPVNFTIPTGFTPPLNAGSAGSAPYVVTSSGSLYDNSPSRLNVAKGGIQAILQTYMATTDFALETYTTGANALYSTWVYYMSAPGGFTFANVLPAVPSTSGKWVANPCYLYITTGSATIKTNCASIAAAGLTGITATVLSTNKYMFVASASDDPSINDVLYASGLSGVCVVYNGPTPATPYPPNFSLLNYENGGILETYAQQTSSCAPQTGPTNAGYVPFSAQVMYAQRGFGFYVSSQSANSATVAVPLTSAGQTPTTTSIQTALAAFTAKLGPESNSTTSTEIKAAAVQSPLAALMTQAKTYLATTATNGSGCALHQYVVLITDGLPTEDLSGKFWPPLGSTAAAGYGVTASFNADGSLNTTNDQAVVDLIAKITALNAAGIRTFVIGLGAGVDPTLNPSAANTLTAMAVAGGTASYFPATDPATLASDLDTILQQVLTGSASTSSAAVNSTVLNSQSVVYGANFTVSDSPYSDWTGNIAAFPVNAVSGAVDAAHPLWQAQPLLDAKAATGGWPTTRLVATWNPATAAGAPFEWASLSPAQQTQLQPTDTLGAFRLNYLRGDSAQEKRRGGAFRNRSHLLGDIVNSNPIYIGAPNGPYTDTSYAAFVTAHTTRSPLLYVGANDGMLHGFDPLTGNEKFSYIPNGIFANLQSLTNPLYNSAHRYFADGSAQAADVMFTDGTWHTVLVSGEGAGGSTIFGLDVTNPDTITNETGLASSVLWEFSDTDMGLSFSTPTLGRVTAASQAFNAAPGFAVFFGNGYNSLSGHAIFYAVDPKTGTLIRKIDLCAAVSGACSATLPNGLSSVVVGNSNSYADQPVDVAYAGDLQGNLWAISISDPNPSNWTVRVVFQARDGSGNVQPITTAPLLSLNPLYPSNSGFIVFFGTGQLLANTDLTSTARQSFYGVWDKGSATAATRSLLQAQTITDVSASVAGTLTAIRTDTAVPVNWVTKQGWYFDLPDSGERVVTQALIIHGGVIFTSNVISATACTVNFSSWLMDVNYSTGGAFTNSQLKIPNASANAVGLSLGNVYATSPTTINISSGGNDILVRLSSGITATTETTGGLANRPNWWQLP